MSVITLIAADVSVMSSLGAFPWMIAVVLMCVCVSAKCVAAGSGGEDSGTAWHWRRHSDTHWRSSLHCCHHLRHHHHLHHHQKWRWRWSLLHLLYFLWKWLATTSSYWQFPSVLRHYWLDDRNGIRPIKSWMLVCWWWQFVWSFTRLIAPVITTIFIILSSSKIQNGDILIPANPGTPGKWPLKRRELSLTAFAVDDDDDDD